MAARPTNNTRSTYFTRRMAALKFSTTNHYARLTQNIQTEYWHTHNKDYLTTERKKQDTLFWYPLSILVKENDTFTLGETDPPVPATAVFCLSRVRSAPRRAARGFETIFLTVTLGFSIMVYFHLNLHKSENWVVHILRMLAFVTSQPLLTISEEVSRLKF